MSNSGVQSAGQRERDRDIASMPSVFKFIELAEDVQHRLISKALLKQFDVDGYLIAVFTINTSP